LTRRPLLLACSLVLGAALTAVCALLALAGTPARANLTHERLAAQQRWELRPFSGYRIVSRMGECMQRGEFRGERIVRVERHECFDRIRTVETLFALVERMEAWGLSTPRCAPSGCVCRETRAVEVEYDEHLGYPRTIRLHKFRAIDWPGLLRNPRLLPAALDCGNPPPIEMLTVSEVVAVP
jgi:hypothetical protein